jgi:hypothetical protein
LSSGPLDIFDKGKTGENRRRKATGLKLISAMTAGPPKFFMSRFWRAWQITQARNFKKTKGVAEKMQDYRL